MFIQLKEAFYSKQKYFMYIIAHCSLQNVTCYSIITKKILFKALMSTFSYLKFNKFLLASKLALECLQATDWKSLVVIYLTDLRKSFRLAGQVDFIDFIASTIHICCLFSTSFSWNNDMNTKILEWEIKWNKNIRWQLRLIWGN